MPKVKLHTSVSDEANFGTERFPVDNDGTVEVPSEAVESLLRIGGYELAEPQVAPAPDGHVNMWGEPGSSISWGGATYETDQDGMVTLPLAAFHDVQAHGFAPEPRSTEVAVEPIEKPAVEAPQPEQPVAQAAAPAPTSGIIEGDSILAAQAKTGL